jgi:GT2 family glycosyltransferase
MDPQVVTLPLKRLAVPLRALRGARPQPARPRLSVVVVNYHSWHDTASLVRQLRASPCLGRGAAEVVVVDNNSPPDPAADRLRRLGGVSLRRWQHNRGFARAVNEGCRLSQGDWVLLLNPDVTLGPGFLDGVLGLADRLRTCAHAGVQADPRLGIVGFHLRNPDGSRQLSAGPFPTLLGTLAGLLRPRCRRKYRDTPEHARSEVDWVTGCCLLVRRSCWEELGGFDPEFFLYYEDVDLCRRARGRGWAVAYEPGLSVVHHHPLHARAVPPHLRLITRHALLTYARKHWARWQFRLLGHVVRLEAWFRRWRARRAGDADTARTFAALGRVARDLLGDRPEEAGRRLLRMVRRQEESLATLPLRRHPQP